MSPQLNVQPVVGRGFAVAIHLGATLLIAGFAATLVFGVWYPYPYRSISGGLELFALVVGVDLVIGPMLTAVVFNPAKTRAHLKRDLSVIVVLQACFLAYGVHTVFAARPVYMVHEVDRFRVVSAADLDPEDLALAADPYKRLPLFGPKLIGTRVSEPGPEQLKSLMLALEGKDISRRPSYYREYQLSRADVLSRARSISSLFEKFPDRQDDLHVAIASTGRGEGKLRYLPLVARQQWVAFVDEQTAEILGYAPFDGF